MNRRAGSPEWISLSVTNTQNNLTHNTLSKWLLTTTLFLGLFTFSGYFSTVHSHQYQPPKTELIHFARNSKRTFSYKAVIAPLYKVYLSYSVFKSLHKSISLLHSRLVKTRLGSNLILAVPSSCTAPFSSLKTIPQSSNEDVRLSHRG